MKYNAGDCLSFNVGKDGFLAGLIPGKPSSGYGL